MAAPAVFELKSLEFRREREAAWRELEELVARMERPGGGRLAPGEIERLPVLYRATVSSLSVARAISLDRNLLEYLESLSQRAYFCVYGPRRLLGEVVRDFFCVRFPVLFRRYRWYVALSGMFLILGAVTGFLLTLRDTDLYYSLVSDRMAQGRDPGATTEYLRSTLFSGGRSLPETLLAFATFLFTHNAQVTMLTFALGFLVGLPTFLLLFTNGLVLGAMSALFHSRNLGIEWWSWLLPHGITEILAVMLGGGAGLAVARSLVFPGRHSRLHNLALQGREAGLLVIGAVVLLLVAGLIEGIFRQTVHDLGLRYAVAVASITGWALYFSLAGRRTRP